MQRFDANYFLTTYLSQVNVKGNAAVLDVGAGDGLVTLEVLLPRLPNFKKLVVSDKSKKMVDFAKNRFHDERIETIQMDIVHSNKSFKGYFDHIFSFYCLNNVPEEKYVKHWIFGDSIYVFQNTKSHEKYFRHAKTRRNFFGHTDRKLVLF